MTCRLEKQLAALLEAADIAFTRPDSDRDGPTRLDFHLTELNLYIEVKQFHSLRISDQLAKVPEKITAIVLQGPCAVEDFARLCRALSSVPVAQPDRATVS